MHTLTIELTNDKAYKLLRDMEELNLIRFIKQKKRNLSALRGKIKTPMANEEIEQQLSSIRKEWKRNT